MKRRIFAISTLVIIALGTWSFERSNYFEISKHIDIFTTLFKEVNTYYVDDVNPGELMKTGIEAMLLSLDPYTNYIPESQIEDFRFQTTGEYGGIGAQIQREGDWIVISNPYMNAPAREAGLRMGDEIRAVDGKSIKGMAIDEVSDILKGEAGTSVIITIQRPGAESEENLTVKRQKIQVECVPYYGLLEDSVGYIKLTSFTDKASPDVRSALEELLAQDAKGIILDLRGNPGGLLREAVEITNLFVDRGIPIVMTKGKLQEWDKTYASLNEPVSRDIPLAVLVNGQSASASEIVSGSIQDLDRGVIIGEQSFGKGLVQQPLDLSYGAKMKVTVAKYYTSSGRCIQALDYGDKDEEGKAKQIPDSLRTEFKTKNGRIVRDGQGIDPDVTVQEQDFPAILVGLLNDYLIFDFAVQEAQKLEDAALDYTLSDAQYAEFVAFAKDREFTYQTGDEKRLEKLVKSFERADSELDMNAVQQQLMAEIEKKKADDFSEHERIIRQLIEEHIVLYHHADHGQVSVSLKSDEPVEAAQSILRDPARYRSLLNPQP